MAVPPRPGASRLPPPPPLPLPPSLAGLQGACGGLSKHGRAGDGVVARGPQSPLARPPATHLDLVA